MSRKSPEQQKELILRSLQAGNMQEAVGQYSDLVGTVKRSEAVSAEHSEPSTSSKDLKKINEILQSIAEKYPILVIAANENSASVKASRENS